MTSWQQETKSRVHTAISLFSQRYLNSLELWSPGRSVLSRIYTLYSALHLTNLWDSHPKWYVTYVPCVTHCCANFILPYQSSCIIKDIRGHHFIWQLSLVTCCRFAYRIKIHQNFDIVWTGLLGMTCVCKLEEKISSIICNYRSINQMITSIRWTETPDLLR